MPPTLEVLKPGLLTTVQDLGRYGYQRFGVSVAGAMDSFSHRVANRLMGNEENAATLECTILGPTLHFLASTTIAVAGANLSPQMNERALPMWQAMRVNSDDVLSFSECRSGCRAYLAVAGGIDVPVVLGSRSTHTRTCLGGFEGRALKRGDLLFTGESKSKLIAATFELLDYDEILSSRRIRLLKGPQFGDFEPRSIEDFLGRTYRVSSTSDRMGLRLEGPKLIHRNAADIISDAVPLGTVQVPANGQPIVLGADRQTTGGYPKVAVVIAADFPVIAQLKPQDEIRFELVSLDEALKALKSLEEKIQAVR